jgi:hypothetical protein
MDKNKLFKKLVLAVRLAVSLGIIIYLVGVLDGKRFSYVLAHLRFEYAWFAPILVLLGLYCLGVRWSIILPYFGVQITKKESFIYYLVGNFYNILMPGAIGGDVIRVGICAVNKKKPLTAIATTVLLERVFGLLVVLLIGAVAILGLPDGLRQQLGTTLTMTFLLFSLGTLLSAIAGWFLLHFIPLARLQSKIEKILLLPTLINLLKQIQQIQPRALLAALCFNLFSQVSDIIASYFLARAILIDVPLLIFFVVIPIVYLSTVLPISLGGLGVREGTLAFLLARLGIQNSDAVTFALIVYLNRVLISLIGGIIQFSWQLPTQKR